jgi:hypothetical protein
MSFSQPESAPPKKNPHHLFMIQYPTPLPNRMPDEDSGYGPTSFLYDALNTIDFNTANAATWQKGSHTKLAIEASYYMRECPNSYAFVEGKINKDDEWGVAGGVTADNIAACAMQCDTTRGCLSFKYNSSTKKCIRLKQKLPTNSDSLASGWTFCFKVGKVFTPTLAGWKTEFGHGGSVVTSDVGVPSWAYWERCLSMTGGSQSEIVWRLRDAVSQSHTGDKKCF